MHKVQKWPFCCFQSSMWGDVFIEMLSVCWEAAEPFCFRLESFDVAEGWRGGVMSAAEWVDGRTSWKDAEQASYPSLVSGSLSDLGFCIFDFLPLNCSFYFNREKAIARSMNVYIYGV